jgi:hypothetical protein
MAQWYSNQFIDEGNAESAFPTPRPKADPRVGGKLSRYVCSFNTPAAVTGEKVILATLPSSCVIAGLWVSFGAMSGNTAAIGVYEVGEDHNGAEIDFEVLMGSLGMGTGRRGFFALGQGSGDVGYDAFHYPLWKMASFATGTYTEDPSKDFDVVWNWEVVGAAITWVSVYIDVIH